MHRPVPLLHRRSAVRTAAVGTAALALTGTVFLGPPARAATTLVVSADRALRPVTHVASGGLYGLATDSTPADSLVTPLKPNTFVQMAPGGRQLPNGEPTPAGDALVVAAKAARAGAHVVIRMPDWYPNFPYKWVSWTDWLSAVDKQVASVKSSGATNIAAWEIWNEPDWTWNTSAAGAFDDGWTRTYREIRAKDTATPIQGPSYSYWNQGAMRQFLTDAKANGTLPDIVSWHELGGSQSIAGDVAAYRALESSLGIGPRPISIEEYGTTSEVGVPGPLAGYIAKFERAGVHDAELAFWNHYGTLGDTLTDTGGSPNGAYWLYRWYGDMSGTMLTTTPPAQTGLDGAASLSGDGKQISVILGGGSGADAVTINGLSSLPAFGGTVHVKLEYTPSRGRTTAVPGPSTISESDYTVANGSVTVPVTMNSSDGYHLVVTPAGSGGTGGGTGGGGTGGSSACKVTATVSSWSGGMTENITIANTGSSAINGWSLVFTLPSGQTITSGWNATYSPSSGQVTAKNLSYNGSLAPGASTSIGFQANQTGNAAAPTSFTLNGSACTTG